jgi:23S rRNA pseudouridine2457 synthase
LLVVPKLILFNKPFNVLSQFTGEASYQTLAAFITEQGFYPAGRLDKDSEGLLLLTDDGKLQQSISDPRFKLGHIYLAQLEGEINGEALDRLSQGVKLKDGITRPAKVCRIDSPALWPRNPPIRERKFIPTSWIQLTLFEGKNRQVRRMAATVGYPVLRLIRWQIGDWGLAGLQPGEFNTLDV